MPVGVVVMAYGTPRSPEDVEAYYTHIRRGRPPTPEQLADLQRRLLVAAAHLVRPGGVLAYSVCTLTVEETIGVDLPHLESLPPPSHPWEPWGRGARLLPHAAGTDGMFLLQLRVPQHRLPGGRRRP